MSIDARLTLAEIEQRVCDIVSECLSMARGELKPSDRFYEDLGIDSLDVTEILMSAESTFSVTLPHHSETSDSVYKAVFTRADFRICDLAELVYLQRGTGPPQRSGWSRMPLRPSATPRNAFTQLDGKWQPASDSPLFDFVSDSRPYLIYRRRSDGMRCVLIPAALVEIGSDSPQSLPDERPLHTVELDAFLIDAEPVSTAAYCRFLNSVGPGSEVADWFLLDPRDHRREHMPVELDDGEWKPVPGVEQLPMVLVSWYGANAYSLWANGFDSADYSRHLGFLPTEAQWEYAARGLKSREYPPAVDSDAVEPFRCAQHEPGAAYTADSLPMAPVHEPIGVSPFGLHHMAGNVWQWCRDWYAPDFYQWTEARMRNPANETPTGIRSERGGSWVGPAKLCRSSFRRGRGPLARGRCLGFRCVSRLDTLPEVPGER